MLLLVTKTTNFELHGETIEAKVAQGRVAPDALVRLKLAHREHYETLERVRGALRSSGVKFDEISRETDKPSNDYAAVMTLGGDGTLLAASHQMAGGGRIYGIRSSASSVGYLCCAGPDEVAALIPAVAADRCPTLPVWRLSASVTRAHDGSVIETLPVLNDVLYTNANPAATTRYKLTVGGVSEVHRSSGLWMATGVGSTAAIHAAGGAKRPMDDGLFQYCVRELYRIGAPEPTLAGGLFDPDRDELMIENRCPDAVLALDGQHGTLSLAYGDRVRFRRAPAIRLGRPLVLL